jgi:hypothetical protein
MTIDVDDAERLRSREPQALRNFDNEAKRRRTDGLEPVTDRPGDINEVAGFSVLIVCSPRPCHRWSRARSAIGTTCAFCPSTMV